ncbi:MAG: sigma-70 family RNA polymerase sigma factor [Planctomycetales bacterium]|nr:sigma-70 family RNA polymerase sigma factor [Planctomycetales bacterium]
MAELLTMHRSKLRRMVEIRLDRRLAARVDPSDVVQEALITATKGLPNYAAKRPVSFYPWLRVIALNRLVDLHRRHLKAERRSVCFETPMLNAHLPDESRMDLAQRLLDDGTSPSRLMQRAELLARANEALAKLEPGDREILVLRYLEELPAGEVAEVLGITERTVWRRHARAIERVSAVLGRNTE